MLVFAVLIGAEYTAADQLDKVQELLDAQRISEAMRLLNDVIDRNPKNARAFLLRSTARFLEGKTTKGRKDLDRALALDPNQRQAWLNRAGLDLTEQNYDAAFEALQRAQEIDPTAPENELNLGAVLLLRGDIESFFYPLLHTWRGSVSLGAEDTCEPHAEKLAAGGSAAYDSTHGPAFRFLKDSATARS